MISGTPSGTPKPFRTLPKMEKDEDKIRENRLRMVARRRGLVLVKSRRRDLKAVDFGTYMLLDPSNNDVIVASSLPNGYGLSLDDVEREIENRSR